MTTKTIILHEEGDRVRVVKWGDSYAVQAMDNGCSFYGAGIFFQTLEDAITVSRGVAANVAANRYPYASPE